MTESDQNTQLITAFDMLCKRLDSMELSLSRITDVLSFEQNTTFGVLNSSAIGINFIVSRLHTLTDPDGPYVEGLVAIFEASESAQKYQTDKIQCNVVTPRHGYVLVTMTSNSNDLTVCDMLHEISTLIKTPTKRVLIASATKDVIKYYENSTEFGAMKADQDLKEVKRLVDIHPIIKNVKTIDINKFFNPPKTPMYLSNKFLDD